MNPKSFFVLPLLLVAACGTLTQSLQSVTAKHEDYTAPAHTASSANVTLESVLEAITVDPLASGSANYLSAKVDYVGSMTYTAAGANDSYGVTLTESASNISYSGGSLEWGIGIDPKTPLNLSARSSSGSVKLNLNDFTLTGLTVGTSSGAIDLSLPAAEQQYDAAVSTSSGSIAATLEDSTHLNFNQLNSSSGSVTLNTGSASTLAAAIQTSSGAVQINGGANLNLNGSITTSSGHVTVNFDSGSAAKLNLSTSSGNITIGVPKDTAVRLEVIENSSGDVSVGTWLHRVSGSDRTGVWETDGFAQAERQITIMVTHDGSGDIEIL